MKYLNFPDGYEQRLPTLDGQPATVHVFDEDSIDAINSALAARRPLLVRGEPGTGKSQLARAAAAALGRAFLSFTVDARSEARDLRFTVDTVARLAEAQILGHREKAKDFDIQEHLAEERFTEPGPLWWVFNWKSAAEQQAKIGRGAPPWSPENWTPKDGVVLLIDEIDKSDPAVPNGLLEALGEGRFRAPSAVEICPDPMAEPPLVVVTTNEERALPDAFLRRCLVLQLGWPSDEEALTAAFVARGRAHFPDLGEEILVRAAEMTAKDRADVAARGVCPPGGAEYLDLLRVVDEIYRNQPEHQLDALQRTRKFTLRKHPQEPAW